MGGFVLMRHHYVWGGQILELADFDFEHRSHVEGSGWPFPKSTLKEFYERALRFEGWVEPNVRTHVCEPP